jgi:outer membrane protein assembly factor BamB
MQPHSSLRPAVVAVCLLLVTVGASGCSSSTAPTARSPGTGTAPRSATPGSGSARQAVTLSPAPVESGGQLVGPWSATALTVTSIGPILASGADSVYGRERDRLDRFDPRNGKILAQAAVDPATDWPALVTAGALWQTLAANGTVTVQALDLRTLRELRSVRIAAPTPTVTPPGPCACDRAPAGSQWQPVLAAGTDASTLFLGNAGRVYALDPVSGALEHQAAVDGLVGGMAVATDGSRLYVAVNVPTRSAARLLVLDVRHGLSTISDTPLDGGTIRRLLVTRGGVWATTNTGHEDNVRFAPLTDLARSRVISYLGELSATLAGGLVWVGGNGEIVCADASTGTIRGRHPVASMMGRPYSLGSVQRVAGRWLAAYLAPDDLHGGENRGLATFTPPSSCH